MSVNLKKINLKKEGDWANIPVKDLHCTLSWTKPVDLDFHAYYLTKNKNNVTAMGFLSKLFGMPQNNNGEGRVYYAKRGSKNSFPYIYLDQDAGIGDVGGDNEENLYFTDLEHHDYILIVANIFAKSNVAFSSYDGKVVLTANGEEFTVPLTSNEIGGYCVVAYIDNTGDVPKLINTNKTLVSKPSVSSFLKAIGVRNY